MPRALLLVVHAVLLLVLIALMLALWRRLNREKRAQDRLVSSLRSLTQNGDIWFRIKLSRPAYFAKWLKLTGCEARGLLINTPNVVRVVAEFSSGEKLDWTYPKESLAQYWIGNTGIASSNMHWFALGSGNRKLMVTADTGVVILQSREATADICRMIAPQFHLPGVARSDFALEKNPVSLVVLVLLFALVFFAIVDGGIVNKYELLEGGHALWGMPLALVAALVVYWQLSKRGVSSRESLALAWLLCVALSVAYIPALKRLDQFLSTDSPKQYTYRLEADADFKPVSEGPPEFKYSSQKKYWAQFDIGSTHDFVLLHGPLGLWQLDHAGLDEKIQRFHEEGRDGKSTGKPARP